MDGTHAIIDLGSENGGGVAFNLGQSNAFRRTLQAAQLLINQGKDPRGALVHMRPMANSTDELIRVNATLRKDEWQLFDDATVAAYQEPLVGVAALLDRGLRLNLTNPFGTTEIEADMVSEFTEADVSMSAGTPPSEDRAAYTPYKVPVPVISKGFNLDERVLQASRTRGQTLDVTNAEAAARSVSEGLEKLLFMGGVTHGASSTLYGYTTHPARNTGSLTGNWATLANSNPQAILNDVLAMVDAVYDDNLDGPFELYIPRNWHISLQHNFVVGTFASGLAQADKTIMSRLLEVDGLDAIRPTKQLTNEVVLQNMSRQSIDVGFGFAPTLVQWESQGGMVNHFRSMSIMTFRVKQDYAGRSGTAHYSV